MSRAVPPEESLEGHYAGPVTRLTAFAADSFFIGASYGFLLASIVFVFNLLSRSDQIEAPSDSTVVYLVGLVIWIYLYNSVCWWVWWKTPGMGLLGLRVVERDGIDLRARTAFRRGLWWQLCFLVPLSQIGIIVGRERRALHDVLAGTTVVYDWNARDARWRLLARQRVRGADDQRVTSSSGSAARTTSQRNGAGSD